MKLRFVFSDTGRVWEPSLLNFSAPRLQVQWTLRGLAWAIVIGGLLLAMLMTDTHAQGVPLTNASVGIFDNIQEQYMQKAMKWESGLRSIALSLFGGLAVISIAWTFIKIVLQKNEATAFIPTMSMQILTLGFFLYLVENGTSIARMVLQSFEAAGQRVGGAGNITPSYVVINGFDCVFRIIEKTVEMSLSDSIAIGLPLVVCGILLLLSFVGVALLLLVTTIESFFVLYGGIILLGFGALPWTRDIPKNYLIYAINVGVKLFVLSLVVSIGVEFSSDWPAMIVASTNDLILHNTLYLLSGGAVFVAVAWKVPGIAAALTSGSVNFNASDIMGTTAAAAGAGAAAGALATGGLSGLTSAAKGAMQATTAGTSLAVQQGASGLGAAIKGVGNAAGAATSEVGAAMKAKAGFSPPSLAAQDHRGRDVGNLGTRAANNLNQQLQAEREAAAGAAQSSAGNSGAQAAQQGSSSTPASQGAPATGAGGTPAGHAPSSNNAPAPPLPPAGNAASAESGPEFQDSKKDSKGLKPPPLPPSDAAQGGVQINIQTSDD
ncbi:P-type conjugative transfer protein TrbL [Xanthomonas campestris pv. campestris]|uniref:P-type conjugative transfer protein TrbL n=1 Tax=Xanthomonas campestris TaxID=339 RepID=UPI001E3F994D|nr:P-type conjugative transfer protein TrbL [Xanthomonas campestris]MCD0253090.1 P-type conjugative transfer protein TrbL [Xanthomonas campestris pv. campestris]